MGKKRKKKKGSKTKRKPSPPFITGGGGFDYEDRVAAYILAAMLAEQPPFGEETGVATQLHWQTDNSGWGFDDLLVTTQALVEKRIAISCKAGHHVTGSGWPQETAAAIWEQWTSAENNPFRKTTDLMAVVTGVLPQNAKKAWDRLLPGALVGDPTQFMAQYQKRGASNKAARSIVESLRCPAKLASRVSDEPRERVGVIRHLRLWHLDVLAEDSFSVTRAVEWCRSAILSGNRADAKKLFQSLVTIASERRPHSGSVTKRQLVELLAASFPLKVAPSHEASWRILDKHSAELQGDIRSTIRDVVSFTHLEAWSEIVKAAKPGRVVVLEGESGSGKSALAKRLAQGRARTLWLSSRDLEHPTMGAMGAALGATVALDVLLGEERSTDAILVIDGAERLTESGRRAAVKLTALAVKAAQAWIVIITTQEGGADSVSVEISNQSEAKDPVQSVEVRLPEEMAVRSVAEAVGIQISAGASASLTRALRNLKALDCVARAASAKKLTTFPDLVREVWRGLVGTDDARARGEVLKKLGKEDAAVVAGGVPSSAFPGVDEQQIIAVLIRDGVLSGRNERLAFRHDLLGDWARLLTLIESAENAGQLLASLSGSLRWGPAIRLFAEWLLQEGEQERERLVSLVTSVPESALSRTLLEGLFRSPDCGPVVEAMLDNPAWTTPEALTGFLRTFVAVATQPSAICRAIPKSHRESASIRAVFREPIPPLWPAVVAALDKRAQFVAEMVPTQIGTVTRRWLSDLLTVVDLEFVETHQACSRLAVAAARELQARIAESRASYAEEAEHTFEAALYAAPWLPDEVASVALELAARRPEPRAVKDRVAAERRRATEELRKRLAELERQGKSRPSGSISLGPTPRRKRKPVPDGPTREISEEYRKAILRPGVIVRLAMSRSAEAQEALLACSLEDPNDDDPFYSDNVLGNHTGTVDVHGWHPPLYLRGPWLALLRQLPEQGVDAILRLVAAGTAEWLRLNVPPANHPKHDWIIKVTTVTLSVGDKSQLYRGDQDVFGWYRGYGRAGHLMASALMALEYWLYELVDANKSIEWVVARVLETNSSIAPLGVLAALARRNPILVRTSLLPLASSWMLLDWDEHVTAQASMPDIDLFGLKALNDAFDNEAEKWSSLPHRKTSLPWAIASQLALGRKEVIEACALARSKWQAEVDSGECLSTESVERLIALLEPSNLSLGKLADGQLAVAVKWPPKLEARYSAQVRDSNDGMTALRLRQRMRQVLDEGQLLSDEQAELLWNVASSLSDPPVDDKDDLLGTVHDARAAAAAVLEMFANGWLDRYPERRSWCEAAALKIRDRTDGNDHLYGMSMFREHGEAFAGAWAIARLAASDTRDIVRRVIAESMTARHYIVCGQVLRAAVGAAARLRDELDRLFNLVWLWAVLCNLTAETWSEGEYKTKKTGARREWLIDAFVGKKIPPSPIPWEELRLRAARAYERLHRRHRKKHAELDISGSHAQTLPMTWDESHSHGFNWSVLEKVVEPPMPYLVVPLSSRPELAALVEFDRRLIDMAVWTMKRASRGRRHQSDSSPGMLERHTLGRAAGTIAAHEDDTAALNIWETLAPHLAHHHSWAEAFFDEWFRRSRETPEQAKRFHARWLRMIDHAEGLPEWKTAPDSKWYDLQQAKTVMLGLRGSASGLGTAPDRPYLAAMVNRYRVWADQYAADPSQLRVLCHLLQREGAVDLRLPGLVWVSDAIKKLSGYRAIEQKIGTELVALCVTTWYNQSQAVLARAETRSALISIIQQLSQAGIQEIQEVKADLETAMAHG